MANVDNYIILCFIVATAILLAIQFIGDRLFDWLVDLPQKLFTKDSDKYKEKHSSEKGESPPHSGFLKKNHRC